MNGSHPQSAGAAALPRQRTFLGHPLGLYVLFFTEMWERFSYYGMRALLMLYMLNYFKWLQKDASTVYKVYVSFVYVTPIVGGYLADRFLGNKLAVIIGAILMAIGQFLLAFEETTIFYSALVFLMIGNGFFKPNMSTQVGRLYPANDGRRDGAYTIFYMGINLGAFLAPLVCGWLAENTVGGYHTGFTMAGIGMLAALVIYLAGQPLVREVAVTPASPPEGGPHDEPAGDPGEVAGATAAHEDTKAGKAPAPLSEAEADRAPSALGRLIGLVPGTLAGLGVLILVAAPVMGVPGALRQWQPETYDRLKGSWEGVEKLAMDPWDAIMLAMGGVCLLLIAYVASRSVRGMRDRVLTILILGVFVMFFWAAFEQAGNVLNVWADKNTDRYLTQPAPRPGLVPEVAEDEPRTESGEPERRQEGLLQRYANMFRLKPTRPGQSAFSLNPVSTASFQSINALAIFVLAPVFAWLWVVLDRRGVQPSIPMKMFLGLVMMTASVAVMIGSSYAENGSCSAVLKGELPKGIVVNEASQPAPNQVGSRNKAGEWEPYQAGRLTYDKATKTFHLQGVLADNEAERMIEATAPDSYRARVEELRKASEKIGDGVDSVEVKLAEVPPAFDMKYAGLKRSAVEYRPSDQTLVARKKLADKEVKGLLVAAGEPGFRDTVSELYAESSRSRVSAWWLFWSYILATFGELCLSPVGLSMVSKLAPARFATMLMGVWMLTSAFGNFAAGAAGEFWGTVPPVRFFTALTLIVAAAALVLLVLVRLLTKMMHGVK
jgi:POT family proton-dependent oligopeptide transporter